MKTVIHRDLTFTYDGALYAVLQGGPGYGYSISRPSGVTVAEGFDTLAQVRAYVDERRAGGWDLDASDDHHEGGPT